jgi:hypothetical protein
MLKKNLAIIIIILLTLLLMVIVIWLFDRRIKKIDGKMRPVATRSAGACKMPGCKPQAARYAKARAFAYTKTI